MLLHSHTTLQTRILLLVMVWSIFLHNQFISQCISSEYLCGFRTGINLRCCDKPERPWWTRSTSYYLLMWNWMVQSDFSSIFLLCCKSCYFSFWVRPGIRVIIIRRCQFVAEFPEIRHSRIISSRIYRFESVILKNFDRIHCVFDCLLITRTCNETLGLFIFDEIEYVRRRIDACVLVHTTA